MEITKERLQQLEDSESRLQALDSGGVDNWEGYDISLESYHKDNERRDEIDGLYNEIEEAIGEGLEEPAGHGSGYGVTEKASDAARRILKDGIAKILKNKES